MGFDNPTLHTPDHANRRREFARTDLEWCPARDDNITDYSNVSTDRIIDNLLLFSGIYNPVDFLNLDSRYIYSYFN